LFLIIQVSTRGISSRRLFTVCSPQSSHNSLTFDSVKKYGLNMLGMIFERICHLTNPSVSSDDQVRAYIKQIMSQLNKWMLNGKISKLVVVITDKETSEHVERWQFDVIPPILSVQLICYR
jgi:hypothetical protein